jgi:hypothetical protein
MQDVLNGPTMAHSHAPNGLTKDQMNAQPGRMKELTDVINGLTKDTTNAHHGVAVATGTPSGTVLSNGFVTHTIGWQTGYAKRGIG